MPSAAAEGARTVPGARGLSGIGWPTSFPLLRCATRRSAVTDLLTEAVRAPGDRNLFNPSAAFHAGRWHVTYRRHEPGVRRRPRAFWMREDVPGRSWTRSDLTDLTRPYGVAVVADPKLVRLGTELFVTFNSGYSTTRNDLYLMRLAPEPAPPQLCTTRPRQAVEKNWGFFLGSGGLQVLYRVQPLQLLRLVRGFLGDGELVFESSTSGTASVRQLSLGLHPVVRGDDLLVVAHQRVYVRGRRGYLGRPVAVRGALSRGGGAEVEVGRVRLLHSVTSLVRRGVSSNPNLLFATYFSTLQLHGDSVLLGYGVNDNDFAFAAVPARRLRH